MPSDTVRECGGVLEYKKKSTSSACDTCWLENIHAEQATSFNARKLQRCSQSTNQGVSSCPGIMKQLHLNISLSAEKCFCCNLSVQCHPAKLKTVTATNVTVPIFFGEPQLEFIFRNSSWRVLHSSLRVLYRQGQEQHP